MSDFNTQNNRAVWFDIPVDELDRAVDFYRNVLAIQVAVESFNDMSFAVLEHKDGNGGCLVPRASEISSDGGILLYLNVDGRIKDAADKTEQLGGKLIEPIHAIGPHGFRAIILDSEGNRVALHSTTNN